MSKTTTLSEDTIHSKIITKQFEILLLYFFLKGITSCNMWTSMGEVTQWATNQKHLNISEMYQILSNVTAGTEK